MKHIIKFNQFLNEGKVKKDERIDILRDDKYIIVAPLTHVASCKYGAYTHWCSAAPGSIPNEYWDSINRPNSNERLIYIIRKDIILTPEQRDKTDRYYYLLQKEENSEIEEDSIEQDELIDLRYDKEALDMTKIAVEYNKKMNKWWFWSGNNIPLEYYSISDLPVDKYVIDAIENYCNN